MNHEYEATFLAVHAPQPQHLRGRLCGRRGWVRLRDEGTRATLALKQVTDATTIDGTKEVEIELTDLRATAEILSPDRSHRGPLPGEPPRGMADGRGRLCFRHMAGPSDLSGDRGPRRGVGAPCRRATGPRLLHARFGSDDEIYKSESGRDILAEPTLLFSDAEKRRAQSADARRE